MQYAFNIVRSTYVDILHVYGPLLLMVRVQIPFIIIVIIRTVA